MSGEFDPYEVLGAAREATPDGLKRLYRDLTKRHHPDVGGDRASWDQLTLAYEILSDPDRRAFFDQTGRIDAPDPGQESQQAHELLAQHMASFADMFVRVNFDPRHDPRRQPIMELVGEYLRKEIAEAEQAIQTGRSHANFARDYIKRITRREGVGGVDRIVAILNAKLRHIEDQIIQVEGVVRVRKIALAALADYSFERDPAAPANDATFTVADGVRSFFR